MTRLLTATAIGAALALGACSSMMGGDNTPSTPTPVATPAVPVAATPAPAMPSTPDAPATAASPSTPTAATPQATPNGTPQAQDPTQ